MFWDASFFARFWNAAKRFLRQFWNGSEMVVVTDGTETILGKVLERFLNICVAGGLERSRNSVERFSNSSWTVLEQF